MNPNHLAVIAALVSYALSSGCYLHSFSKNPQQGKLYQLAYGLFIFASFLMTSISINSKLLGAHTVSSGFLLITILAWITLIAQMFFKMRLAGTFVAPLITLITLIHLLTATPHHTSQANPQPFEGLLTQHILASVIGQAFAILAVAVAILYLFQQRAMKKKQLHRLLESTLSLSGLEKALTVCLWTGFVFITTGLILGSIYSQFYPHESNSPNSKIVWALLVWIWYLVTLLARNVYKVSARKIAIMAMVGFGIMSLGFFGLLDL